MPAENLTRVDAMPSAPTTSASLSQLPFRHDESSNVSANLIGAWFGAAIAFALALWWFSRRTAPRSNVRFRLLGGPRSRGALELVAKLQLAPQASLHIVRWHGDEWLIGCHAQAMAVLSRHTASVDGGAATVNGDGLDEQHPT